MDISNVLSPSLTRNLGDRSYEKRKTAALEIESIIREINSGHWQPSQDADEDGARGQSLNKEQRIRAIINTITQNFIKSTQANQRKGGLIGLAATAIGLMGDTSKYLNLILPAVMSLLKDQESRVRYYACEALYNVTKVTRSAVLPWFSLIFDGLCTLYEDADMDVKNGAQLLDRLIKDVVTESDQFDVNGFMPILTERIHNPYPFVRQLILGWILTLDTVPDIDMLEHLPRFLDGLFDMLEDPPTDLSQQADYALREFLREIKDTMHVNLGSMIRILVKICNDGAKDDPQRTGIRRLNALRWIEQFIKQGQANLFPHYPEIMVAVLAAIACTHDKEISGAAVDVNNALLDIVQSEQGSKLDVKRLIQSLIKTLASDFVETRIASLRWVDMLLMKFPLQHLDIQGLFPVLLDTLADKADEVVNRNLEVLARISVNKHYFDLVLENLLRVFRESEDMLEKRGNLIITRLSALLNGEKIYRALAEKIMLEDDIEFCSLMVQTLNLILLTSPELFELRVAIKRCLAEPKARDLFVTLYNTWSLNPVATLSLCLIAQVYELGSSLIFLFANMDITVGFLMQIDKLVQLIESPIFVHLRLQLLDPHEHPYLQKILNGLLMLLPQSPAFDRLRIRLQSVNGYCLLNCIPKSKYATSRRIMKETQQLNFEHLLQHFETMQAKFTDLRRKRQSQKSFLNQPQPSTDVD